MDRTSLCTPFLVSFFQLLLACGYRSPGSPYWGTAGVPANWLRAHHAILAHPSPPGMRLLRQLRQLRQIVTSYSNGCASRLLIRADADLGGLRALEPLPHFTFTKSPLPANFDSRNFLTFRPKA